LLEPGQQPGGVVYPRDGTDACRSERCAAEQPEQRQIRSSSAVRASGRSPLTTGPDLVRPWVSIGGGASWAESLDDTAATPERRVMFVAAEIVVVKLTRLVDRRAALAELGALIWGRAS
jgi:hypothetical protein